MTAARTAAADRLQQNRALALGAFRVLETGDAHLAAALVAPDFVNREAEDDPEDAARNLRGPAGLLATGAWLRAAFADLRFEVCECAAEGAVVMVRSVMTGRHTGAFQGLPASGRPFRHDQVHIFRIEGGRIAEHRAVRDDLGLMLQLGWAPPRP